jgi:hypothetical protein
MPYVTAFCITFSNRGLGVPNSCCLCLGLAMHGIEVLTSDVRIMGWPLPPSAYLPDHLSVNTLHTYRTDHRPLAITSCEKTAPRHLVRKSEDGSLLHCKLPTADNQKTASSPSSWREVLPTPLELELAGQRSRTPDRPTDRPNKGTIMQGSNVCAVRSSTPDVGYLEWQLALLCRSRRERKHWNEGVPVHILPDRRFWPSGPQETNVLLLQSANGLTICGDQGYRKPCQHLNTMWAVQKEERRRGALNQSRARSSRKWNCDVKPRTLIDCPAAGCCSEDEVGGI